MRVVSVPAQRAAEVVEVLADSFYDYPVLRYVLGPSADYDARLRALLRLFVDARELRGEPVLGLAAPSGELLAAALISLPGERSTPAALTERRERLWVELGADSQARYEHFVQKASSHTIREPHHHLNMIGVRHAHMGRGLARLLIDAVHALADAEAPSIGVSLTTESAANVPLYQHLGYRLLGHSPVDAQLESWAFFRPRAGAAVT
jgi:GNAT superfamily N-acetyltransferase